MAASQQSENLCENSMAILKLMCDKILGFSGEEVAQTKVKQIRSSLRADFAKIFEWCMFVLQASRWVHGRPSVNA